MADILFISGFYDPAAEATVAGLRAVGLDTTSASLDRPGGAYPNQEFVYVRRAPDPISNVLSREIENSDLKPRFLVLFVSISATSEKSFVWLMENFSIISQGEEKQIMIVAESRTAIERLVSVLAFSNSQYKLDLKKHRLFLLSSSTVAELSDYIYSQIAFPLAVYWDFSARYARATPNLSGETDEEKRVRERQLEKYDTEKRLRHEQGDATAFAPKTLKRGSAGLIRVVVHKSTDAKKVILAARRADRKSAVAGQRAALGLLPYGVPVTVALDIAGGVCEASLQTIVWNGKPLEFSFPISVSPNGSVKSVAIAARIFLDGAQVGTIAFTRPVFGGFSLWGNFMRGERLRRFHKVFLSYASADRDEVILVASAYRRVGINCFFDRVSLAPGEQWHPRLLEEIERSDLFHLFWSQSASKSEWVERETIHAITRRNKSLRKEPEITLQMLDGPPWAPHPPTLGSLNFDDFERAAIVGYRSAKSSAE